MIFARFSRSASACFAIARCISMGRSTAFSSTIVTLMPHGSVCLSRISWRLSFNLSREESSSSSVACPRIDRSVVCESWDVA